MRLDVRCDVLRPGALEVKEAEQTETEEQERHDRRQDLERRRACVDDQLPLRERPDELGGRVAPAQTLALSAALCGRCHGSDVPEAGEPHVDVWRGGTRASTPKAGMANYAVCTECDFLRVHAEQAYGVPLPRDCPQCGAELVVVEDDARFAPAYVARVSRSLYDAEPPPSPQRQPQ